MAIYNLDKIIDTIVEASNPAEPVGLQRLEKFTKLGHDDQKKVYSRFIARLKKLSKLLGTRARQGIEGFYTTYKHLRGRVPERIYTNPGLIGKTLAFLYDKDGVAEWLRPYSEYFNIQPIEVNSNRLRDLLRNATDPEGKRDQIALERASTDAAAYKAAIGESFENDPIEKVANDISLAFNKLESDLNRLIQFASADYSRLEQDIIAPGVEGVKAAATQGAKIARDVADEAGNVVNDVTGELGNVAKQYDPRLGYSPADAVRARQVKDAEGFFQNAPSAPVKSKFKPMDAKRHQELLRQYKEADEARKATAGSGGYSESIVDQVANMLTEDPDIIIS